MAQPVSLSAFYDRLDFHNWYFEKCDDPGYYRRGKDEHDALVEISRQSAEHTALFNAMAAYHTRFSDTKPVRPAEVAA